MQDVMVMGLASMALVNKLPTAPTSATVTMAGLVHSAKCRHQVNLHHLMVPSPGKLVSRLDML